MKLNFFTKLVAITLGMLILTTGVLGFISLSAINQNLSAQAENDVVEAAKILASKAEIIIQNRLQVGKALANNKHAASSDPSIIQETVNAMMKADAVSYDGIFVMNAQGVSVASFPEEMIGIDFSDRDYFVEVMRTGEQYISDVLLSRASGNPIVMIATPIKQGDRVVGAIGQAVKLDILNVLRSEFNLGKGGYTSITTNRNNQAIVISHPNESYATEQRDVSDVLIVKSTMGGNDQIMRFANAEGEKMFGASTTVGLTNWIVVATMPESELMAPIYKVRNQLIVVVLVIILLGAFGTWLFSKRIAKRLKTMVVNISALTEGDLNKTFEIDQDIDELGQLSRAIDKMKNELQEIISNIAMSSDNVLNSSKELKEMTFQASISSEEVANTILEIAKGATDQAKDTERASESIDALNQLLEEDKANISDLNQASKGIEHEKEEGFVILKALIEKSNENSQAATNIYNIILSNNESTSKIENASAMIQSIADQTNLLALNAAIEAARAGEAGRGFAVVADEIRKLAGQSNNFTSEIKQLVNDLKDSSENAVQLMEKTKVIVNDQVLSVQNTEHKFIGIANAIDVINRVIEKLNASAKKMMENKDSIIEITQGLSAISEENAASTEEASAAMQEQSATIQEIAVSGERMSEVASALKELTEKFKY